MAVSLHTTMEQFWTRRQTLYGRQKTTGQVSVGMVLKITVRTTVVAAIRTGGCRRRMNLLNFMMQKNHKNQTAIKSAIMLLPT